ncbi:MAG TPA: alpha hydrolase [Candidatus Methanoculleus thermohydrogenotrophicum]|jgi:predicted subunit of tRNA(5-methylaminomethyl-2-thiouridylate) methyltransferase|nr:alpha hydrolase [Candidatus Methanoculleus thermohydrogenotrophicum]NLM82640.1 alpha hydrolase [Candidatus Methanoculleus thermohydrogenotrophicum]HOB18230.1 alpha hydrolase [Candidatus Methanoculleus thermohydrogenotrophicum]HPZ37871.1 alpha hydrolase [Candidatus Methanoculleus thermohydrogenotrophicum]HQC91097.1 alpha hydrolase [Candidatus Methanoculleus thermohydrogenotrophicum]
MEAGVLFSGGKDSALAAILLARDYGVELNTCVLDPDREVPGVQAAAAALNLPFRRRVLGRDLLEEAVDLLLSCGYPNDAINMIHRAAIKTLAGEYTIIGDGTRRDDRVPRLERSEVQHLEATTGCSYVRPLLGYGKPEVERLAGKLLVVQYGEAGSIGSGDYEQEIRRAVRDRGIDPALFFPPRHLHSLVVGRRET